MRLLDKLFNKPKIDQEDSNPAPQTNNNTIYVNDSFSYFGNGKCGRPLDELDKMDVQESDEAFKKYKREILDVYMKENGFIKYKINAYMRLNKIGLIEYINLQKEAHGSRTFTLNVCILPLYVPHDVFTIGFGDRIGILINGKDFWWDYRDLNTTKKSFDNIVEAIELFILPWFDKYSDENHYQNDLLGNMGIIGDSRLKWITYLYIKNHEYEKAKHYLHDCFHSDEFNDDIEIRKNKTKEIIIKLNDLLHSSKTTEEILEEAILYNIEKYKLPKSLKNKYEKGICLIPLYLDNKGVTQMDIDGYIDLRNEEIESVKIKKR